MSDFWKSKSFKILLAIFVVLSAFFIRGLSLGGISVVLDKAIGFVSEPCQRVVSVVSEKTHSVFGKYLNVGKVYKENEELKKELSKLTKQLGDYEQIKNENENLKSYLDIKEINPDFAFEPATVIGRDPSDLYGSFTIGKGSLHGIKPQDVVITPKGLVGVIDEVSLSSAKVKTSLDIATEIGAKNTRTSEVGIVTGSAELASKGRCALKYIPRNSKIVKGDIIFTTGVGGIFPEGLVVGRVDEIKTESHGKSMYASIVPAQELDEVRNVFVIKNFIGKKDYTKSEESSEEAKEILAEANNE